MSWELVWTGAPWALLGGIVLWWLRDRRKDRAAAEVAERTVDADVTLKDLGAEDARLVYLAKTWDTERAGLQRAIGDRDGVIEWQRAELERRDAMVAHRDMVIESLRRQLDEMEGRIADLSRQLVAARHQLDEFDQRSDKPSTHQGGGL